MELSLIYSYINLFLFKIDIYQGEYLLLGIYKTSFYDWYNPKAVAGFQYRLGFLTIHLFFISKTFKIKEINFP